MCVLATVDLFQTASTKRPPLSDFAETSVLGIIEEWQTSSAKAAQPGETPPWLPGWTPASSIKWWIRRVYCLREVNIETLQEALHRSGLLIQSDSLIMPTRKQRRLTPTGWLIGICTHCVSVNVTDHL